MRDRMKSSVKWYALSLMGVLVVLGTPALAQNGCVDSPENPTAILALAGSAGGIVVALRNRLRRR